MGKKKGKKKNSSKSKKGSNSNPRANDEITTNATMPSNDDADREINPPSIGNSENANEHPNKNIPDPVSTPKEGAVAEELTKLDANSTVDTNNNTSVEPSTDQTIDPTNSSAVEETMNVNEIDTASIDGLESDDSKLKATSNEEGSIEAIGNESPKTQNSAINSENEDGEDAPVFFNARSSDTDDTNDKIPPVDIDDTVDRESKEEDEPEVQVESKEVAMSADVVDDSQKDETHARSSETDDTNDKILPVEIDDTVNRESEEEGESEVQVESKMVATSADVVNDSQKDETIFLNNNISESEADKQQLSPAKSIEQTTLELKPDATADTEDKATKINTSDKNAEEIVDAEDDVGFKDTNYVTGDDDETSTTYIDELPLFHYSRIVGSGLPKGIQNDTDESDTPHPVRRSTCSKFAIVRIDREELVSSISNIQAPTSPARESRTLSRSSSAVSDALSTNSVSSAAAMRQNQREQNLLLSSDLWFQPHSIVASGYGGNHGGAITLTRVMDGRISGSEGGICDASPAVVFALPSADYGGIIDSSGHGRNSGNNSYSNKLYIREGDSRYIEGNPVVSMSFDASGSVLGAVDGGGHCTIWEFKYTTSLQPTSIIFGNPSEVSNTAITDNFYTPSTTPDPIRPSVTPVPSPGRPAQNAGYFSNFMSVLTGMPPAEDDAGGGSSHGGTNPNMNNNSAHGSVSEMSRRSDSHVDQPSQPQTLVPALTAEITNQSRINYPAKWGPPTCLAVDPAYKLKREKSIAVGFVNGQLYLTKKGTFFQRRNDNLLYQAGNRGDNSYRGIESVVWRGPLLAFADATGIKLIDSDNLTRIAHINRPAGASPSLYPSIRDISPSLVFETSKHLMVGWGDCLMQIYVEEHEDDGTSSALSVAHSSGNISEEKKIKRTAACTMAWELDCVACDIVPLDSDHVAVLGLVTLADDEDGIANGEDIVVGSPGHDLELQIVSRKDGVISYSDLLPLIENNKEYDDAHIPFQSLLSARDFRLFSSFALPRMEEIEETNALKALKGPNEMGLVGIDVSFDMNQPLFAGTDSSDRKGIEFKDPHLEWNMKSILYDDDVDDKINVVQCSNDDDSSVDSDDYECIMRPLEDVRPLPSDMLTIQSMVPPTMVVCTESEVILSLTSTVDDAIEYSLENNKCALALSRGLRHKRELRRHNLDELINYYLEAVLRTPRSIENQGTTNRSLSLRRMKLAVKAMPVLLGDRIELWERWIKELENIPGALFLLRKYLPVRGKECSNINCNYRFMIKSEFSHGLIVCTSDPILPSTIYFRILEKMLLEVEQLSKTSDEDDSSSLEIHAQASKHFLESLIAWGTTKTLKDYISFYNFNKRNQMGKNNVDDEIRSTEISLQRRYLQTAAGYLIFPVRDIEEELNVSEPRYEVSNVDSEDSLFDVAKAVTMIASRVPVVASLDVLEAKDAPDTSAVSALEPNSRICLDAMARLRLMQGEYDSALKCFLAIGALHATNPIEFFEESAIRIVNGTNTKVKSIPTSIMNDDYAFVMDLVERHELNQFLFEKDFFSSQDSNFSMPIFALIRLVGLQRVGNFLMEHCVAAGFTYNTTLSEMNTFSFSEEDSTEEPDGILRRGSLPIDKVAEQLERSPSILYWYLHLVFTRRSDFYINFPTSSILPKAVTNLHRKHFQLCIDFAGVARDSSKVLAGIEAYKVESISTPLLTFLKAILPLNGVMPVDARRVLEIERSKDTENDDDVENKADFSSPIFALELAFIIEKYSDETETEAMGVLKLYLNGAKSLPLAVSYAQRQKKFHSKLWDHLISHCLKQASDGTIYGELLEAAALTGADLSQLVERIPPGMVVEGLRSRLVAAVADYRMKLEIYEAAMAAGSEEKVTLMREIGQRVRRGLRYDAEKNGKKSFAELIAQKIRQDEATTSTGKSTDSSNDKLSGQPQTISKTRLRRDHKPLIYSIPRR